MGICYFFLCFTFLLYITAVPREVENNAYETGAYSQFPSLPFPFERLPRRLTLGPG